jgi:MFS family permease
LQATAYHVPHMLVARVVSGIGMGFVNSTVPVIQAEFSPKASRGRFVCMQLSTLNFGESCPALRSILIESIAV